MITEIKRGYRSLLAILALSTGCGELHDYSNEDSGSVYSANSGTTDAGEEQQDSGHGRDQTSDGGLEQALVDGGISIDAGTPPECYPISYFPGNIPPTAIALQIYTERDAPVEVQLEGTDSDGTINVYRVITLPLHGSLDGVEPNLIYNPTNDFVGIDHFIYKVRDNEDADSCPAEVSIVVGSSQ